MRIKGINYDTGVFPGGSSSREVFDVGIVREDMRVIAAELGCNAVRISGGDPERLSTAAQHAAAVGLEVWFSPQPCDLDAPALLELFADCAERAESLRREGGEVVFVAGSELSVFGAGFLPGETSYDRLAVLASPDPTLWAQCSEVPAKMDAFLAEAAATARKQFLGPVTYAAALWEQVDWSPFDIVSVNAYRSDENVAQYREQLRTYAKFDKPLVVTEFGCCTYRGAAGRGGAGWSVVRCDADPPRVSGGVVRDEDEQVRYLHELLAVFESEPVEGAFWFSFANYDKPFDDDPTYDLDVASFGVVKVSPIRGSTWELKQPWEPKAAFAALGARYGC